MTENPFAHSDELVPAQRRFGTASRVMWFVFGFVACFVLMSIASLAVNYRDRQVNRPRDYSQVWSAASPETKPEWLEHARLWTLNGFAIIAAEDVKNASAMVYPLDGRQMTMYEDKDRDGHADTLFVWDKKGRYFEIEMADGFFKQYDFTDDVTAHNGTTFKDYDLDGVFDFKWTTGPQTTTWLMVDLQWCLLIPEGNSKGRVAVNGEWRRAIHVDDQWKLEESLKPDP